MEKPASSSETSHAPRPPRAFRAWPHLFDHACDGVIVPLDGAAGRDLAGPAVACRQLPNALGSCGWVEAPAGHRPDPRQGPALVLPAVRGRPLGGFRLQLGELLLAESRQRRRALRAQGPRATFLPGPPPPPAPTGRRRAGPLAVTRLAPGEPLGRPDPDSSRSAVGRQSARHLVDTARPGRAAGARHSTAPTTLRVPPQWLTGWRCCGAVRRSLWGSR
jgi:hypothetical protein